MKGTWFENDTEKGEQFKVITAGAKDSSAPVALFLKLGNPTAKEIIRPPEDEMDADEVEGEAFGDT